MCSCWNPPRAPHFTLTLQYFIHVTISHSLTLIPIIRPLGHVFLLLQPYHSITTLPSLGPASTLSQKQRHTRTLRSRFSWHFFFHSLNLLLRPRKGVGSFVQIKILSPTEEVFKKWVGWRKRKIRPVWFKSVRFDWVTFGGVIMGWSYWGKILICVLWVIGWDYGYGDLTNGKRRRRGL